MWKKLVILVVFGFALAPAMNAGTEIIRDYGGRDFNQYAPPPPRPIYYAPPPPVRVVVYPRPFFYRPHFRVFAGHRVLVRPHHVWR